MIWIYRCRHMIQLNLVNTLSIKKARTHHRWIFVKIKAGFHYRKKKSYIIFTKKRPPLSSNQPKHSFISPKQRHLKNKFISSPIDVRFIKISKLLFNQHRFRELRQHFLEKSMLRGWYSNVLHDSVSKRMYVYR